MKKYKRGRLSASALAINGICVFADKKPLPLCKKESKSKVCKCKADVFHKNFRKNIFAGNNNTPIIKIQCTNYEFFIFCRFGLEKISLLC